jgi:hypothetical protein
LPDPARRCPRTCKRRRAIAHEGENVGYRVRLIEALISGYTSSEDQAAIFRVLENAKARSDLVLLVGLIGPVRLRYALGAAYYERYNQLVAAD